jgi:RNA polymerase primary sigma factor
MSSGLGWYLDEIGRVPLLTPAEELHLGAIIRAWQDHPDGPDNCPAGVRRRGLRARDRFVHANLRLAVNYVADRCRRFHRIADQDDLIQAANLGLMRAVERFDPARGYKFSTYAYWWMRQSVGRCVDTQARMIRLPAHHGQQIQKLEVATHAHLAVHGIAPTAAQLSTATGLSVERVQALLSEARGCASLDLVLDGDERLGDLLAAPDSPDIDDTPERQQLLEHLSTLEPLAADVVSMLYGLHGAPVGAAEVARLLGLPNARAVRQVEREALQPFRQRIQQLAAPAQPERFAASIGSQLSLQVSCQSEVVNGGTSRHRRRNLKLLDTSGVAVDQLLLLVELREPIDSDLP